MGKLDKQTVVYCNCGQLQAACPHQKSPAPGIVSILLHVGLLSESAARFLSHSFKEDLLNASNPASLVRAEATMRTNTHKTALKSLHIMGFLNKVSDVFPFKCFSRGWRDNSSMVKSIGYSSKGPVLESQHQHGGSTVDRNFSCKESNTFFWSP